MTRLIILSIAIAVLLVSSALTQTGEITVQSITCLGNDGVSDAYIAGYTHRVTIHGQGGAPSGTCNTLNGFIIYSPDGATFENLVANTLPAWEDMGWMKQFTNYFIGDYAGGICQSTTNWTGTTSPVNSGGLDVAVSFNGVSFSSELGWPPGFDGDVWTIQFRSNTADDGLHICIDSTFTPPGGTWKWPSLAGHDPVYPDWGGPYCYSVWQVPCLHLRPGSVALVTDCSGDCGPVDIEDLTNLIDHLFISYTSLCHPMDADIYPPGGGPGEPGDWVVDISDLTHLIDHLFITYPPLQGCI